MKIEMIDKNFKLDSSIDQEGLQFYDIKQEPFKIYGLICEGDRFRRMPEAVAKTISDGVFALHAMTAGGRVRFKTNSPYVAVRIKVDNIHQTDLFALTGVASCDIYADNIYKGTYRAPYNLMSEYENIVHGISGGELKNITLNFPNYSNVTELCIGIDENAKLLPPDAYKTEMPVIYYGSSITQGCCSTRPGSTYQSVISRRLDCNYLNLGFAGNARAEDEIIEYIKKLDMSAFVYDYDHNAPTVDHLVKTHEKMFKAIRESNPCLPILMMPRPKVYLNDEEKLRRDVIIKTYNNAVATGDKNVYYIDNSELTALCGNEGTLEGCHPNDFGFAAMAEAIGNRLEAVL